MRKDDLPLTELAEWLTKWVYEIGFAWLEVDETMQIAALKRGSRRGSANYDG